MYKNTFFLVIIILGINYYKTEEGDVLSLKDKRTQPSANTLILRPTVHLTRGEFLRRNITTNETKVVETRRFAKGRDGKRLETSEESGTRNSKSTESLHLTISLSESDDKNKNPNRLFKSSAERKGWRKFHRKCYPCQDVKKAWRHPSIKWICGAFQRARRSFKSECVMYYRNCQDGTMFRKIHDHRCADDARHGEHFFYDYSVIISGDKTDSETPKDSSYDDSIFAESKDKKRG